MFENSENTKNLLNYHVPVEWRDEVRIHTLYPPIPKNTGNINFDIFDFDMLFNDSATKKLIKSGKTIGCFYIESPGMRSLLRRLDVETFEMLTAASSVIRPGVAESGMMQEFIARHKDPSRRKYLVPEMEIYLGETYGVMIYQEDVIKVAHHIAGLSLEEADLLRRAMSGKMRSHHAMQRIVDNFFSSAKERGLTDSQAKELWRQIESFAGYSFCKAHSASFALLSYQVAFLKAHYPSEFMASVLNNGGGFYSVAVYVQESKRLGLKIELPSINESKKDYVGKGRAIRIGLKAIKNLSHNAIDKIIEERKQNGKYISLADFLVRTKLAYEEAAMLIKCGAMGCFRQTRPTLMRLLDVYLHRRKIIEESYNDLFISETFKLEEEVKTDENYSLAGICKEEYEAFNYMVTRHPLYFFKEWIDKPGIVLAKDMLRNKGRRVKMIGWYMTSKRIKTKQGEIMKFLSLEDLTGTFEAVIFPRVYN
ncbi:MAG: DNA polymerase III subunit alpha, partial [Ignavibacteriaceae bacterium]|nr:DNA polymerase III subunit alpha [Ignavibacteriaceae bacterium]